jgi:hypothetical protein
LRLLRFADFRRRSSTEVKAFVRVKGGTELSAHEVPAGINFLALASGKYTFICVQRSSIFSSIGIIGSELPMMCVGGRVFVGHGQLSSNHNALNHVERNVDLRPAVELARAGRLMSAHRLRPLDYIPFSGFSGDPGGVERVAASGDHQGAQR